MRRNELGHPRARLLAEAYDLAGAALSSLAEWVVTGRKPALLPAEGFATLVRASVLVTCAVEESSDALETAVPENRRLLWLAVSAVLLLDQPALPAVPPEPAAAARQACGLDHYAGEGGHAPADALALAVLAGQLDQADQRRLVELFTCRVWVSAVRNGSRAHDPADWVSPAETEQCRRLLAERARAFPADGLEGATVRAVAVRLAAPVGVRGAGQAGAAGEGAGILGPVSLEALVATTAEAGPEAEAAAWARPAAETLVAWAQALAEAAPAHPQQPPPFGRFQELLAETLVATADLELSWRALFARTSLHSHAPPLPLIVQRGRAFWVTQGEAYVPASDAAEAAAVWTAIVRALRGLPAHTVPWAGARSV